MIKKISDLFIYAAVILFIVLAVSMQVKSCNKIKQAEDNSIHLINALNDSVSYYKNKNKELVATVDVLETTKVDQLLQIKSKDSSIVVLQSTVKDYAKQLKSGGSVTNFTSNSKVKIKDTTTIAKTDTVRVDSMVYVYPTYITSKQNKWLNYTVISNKDTTTLDLVTHHEYSVVIGIRKKQYFADVIDYNPYSEVSQIRAYKVSMPKPKRYGLGVMLGVGIPTKGDPSIFLGLGVTYNFATF